MARDVLFIENPDTARSTSRYNLIRLYVNRNTTMVQTTWDRPTFDAQDDDTTHEVQPGEVNRPDLIALLYYGDLNLYWVVAVANGMVDAFVETTVGRSLRIPSPSYVLAKLVGQ